MYLNTSIVIYPVKQVNNNYKKNRSIFITYLMLNKLSLLKLLITNIFIILLGIILNYYSFIVIDYILPNYNIKTLVFITIILFIAWKIKFAGESEYDGIESGSSDWAKHGEEYEKTSDGRELLNKKSGFILSKDHYLGTDLKKVLINKNVLVVGRIRCW